MKLKKITAPNEKRKNGKALVVTIPNIITLIRILLIPLFIISLQNRFFPCALLLFTIAGISDGLDGFLARHLNQRTPIGAMFDPIADKLLVASAFICLSIMKIIPNWLAVIVISRDVIILAGYGVFMASEIRISAKPSLISKCNTGLQFLTILWELFEQVRHPSFPEIYTGSLYGITAVFTVVSGLHYIYIGLRADVDPSAP